MAGRETMMIIEDFFVPKDHNGQGKLNPPSYVIGRFMFEKFKCEWLSVQVPDGYFARVSVYPTMTHDGVEGFSIRKEIVPLSVVLEGVRTTP